MQGLGPFHRDEFGAHGFAFFGRGSPKSEIRLGSISVTSVYDEMVD
jgi:hypothetical protein